MDLKEKKTEGPVFSVQWLTKIAVLAALSRIIMLFEFPLPFFPPFLKFDFSEIVSLLGGLALGPLAGTLIVLLKCLLHLAGSSTGGVGDLANFLVGAAFVAPAAFYYRRKEERTKKDAVIGLCLGVFGMVAVGALANYFLVIPLYSIVLGLSSDEIVRMAGEVIPLIRDRFTLILYAFSPFNLLKGLLLSIVAFPLYKKIAPIMRKDFFK